MLKNIYLAAPWIDKDKMEEVASRFEEEGYTITHKWWKIENLTEVERSHTLLEEQALTDLQGVLNADAIILFNTSKSEGKAVEQGLAIANNIPIIAIGILGAVSLNVFHYLSHIYTWVPDLEGALDELANLAMEEFNNGKA